jgi:hypothetical protein
MLQTAGRPRSTGDDLAARLTVALDRIEHLIARYDMRAALALRRYQVAQALTVGLAAITPCLIVLAKDNPYTTLGEVIHSLLWRFQTRAGEFGAGVTDEQALDTLVVKVDEVNLQAVARWSAAQVAEAPAATAPGRPATASAEHA